ncbi:MAG: hypothetical protein HFG66_10840 [Hungatella sp.]|nr:hypothetical protein [Hungatella sp.]
MSDNELLLAISSMMDKKLEPLQKDISKLQDNVSDIKVEMRDIKAEMREIDTRIKRIEITQENEILPRLQNIEACYTSTYERYAEGADQIQNTMQDMTLIKKVVTEHSAKLKRIQ